MKMISVSIKNTFIKLFVLLFIFHGFYPFVIASSSEEEEEKPSLTRPSPAKAAYNYSKGFSYADKEKDYIEKVMVKPYISLGAPFISQINQFIKESNQFVLFFMYRFNSPVLLQGLAENAKIAVVFLDRNQCYREKDNKTTYNNFVKELIQKVPTSLIDLKSKSFHQKVIICKSEGKEAFTFVGSANATIDAENKNSEDIFFIQSNKLAKTYIEAFKELFESSKRNKQQEPTERLIDIYHEKRLRNHDSNTDYLATCLTFLKEEDKLDTKFGIEASISSLAISTGFAEGSSKCLDLVTPLINNTKNKILIFFQNYMSYDENNFHEKIISSGAKKLIILEDNQENEQAFEKLEKDSNTVLVKTKPYMDGKFHHKVIIQYSRTSSTATSSSSSSSASTSSSTTNDPILYTGSFNISVKATKSNSENIIGIRCLNLPGMVFSSLLRNNSNLSNNTKIWSFLKNNPKLVDQTMEEYAKQEIERIKDSCRDIIEILNDNVEKMLMFIGGNETQYTLLKKLKDNIASEEDDNEKLEQISNLINLILKDKVPNRMDRDEKSIRDEIDSTTQEIINKVNQELQKYLKEHEEIKYTSLTDSGPKTWLESLSDLIQKINDGIENVEGLENAKDLAKKITSLKKMKSNIANIQEEVNRLNSIKESFKNLVNLEVHINGVLPSEEDNE